MSLHQILLQPNDVLFFRDGRPMSGSLAGHSVAWPLPDASTPEGEAVAAGIYGAFFEAAGRSDRYECSTDGYPAILGGKAAPMFMVALELVSMDKLDECVGFVMKAARNARSRWTGGMWRQHEEWRNRRKAQVIGSLERMFGPGGRTDQVADLVQFSRDVAFDGGDRYLFHALTKLGQLEPGAVGAALDRALDPARAHVLVLAPSARGLKGDRRASASFQGRAHDEEDAAIIDPAEATRPLTPPSELARLSAARRFQLANGLRVALLPTQGLPVVSAELVFDAGEAAAPAHPLLAQQAAAMIALPPDATALAETGVRLDCRATPDHTVCRARGMSVYLDVVIKGLERLITTGDTPQLAVESWQRTAREQVGHRRTQRRLEFERQQRAAVFGADHPYARAGLSSPAAIDELGRDELAAFRAAHYTAANATLVLAGAFDPAAAEAQIRDAFGDWAPGHKDDPVAAPVVAARGARWIGVVERDDDPQVDVAVLYPSAPGMRGQQAARLIVTELLNQRMETIRSERGATYGTYARRSTLVAASAYVLGGAVDAPRAGEAIQAMREGVDSLRRGDDFARRFAQARRVVVQRLVAESTSSAGLAGRLGVLAQFGLPADHFDDVLRQVAAMTPAQVRDLIARELDPRAETVVALGDRAALTAAFAAAGLTGAQLVD